MKKSEMAQDLASIIIINLIDYGIDLSYDKAQNLAHQLIIKVETNGMLPPERFKTPVKNQTCEWEKE